jgi:hypothetical protein
MPALATLASATVAGGQSVHLNAGALAVLEVLQAIPGDGNPHMIRGLKDGAPYDNLSDVRGEDWQRVAAWIQEAPRDIDDLETLGTDDPSNR